MSGLECQGLYKRWSVASSRSVSRMSVEKMSWETLTTVHSPPMCPKAEYINSN